MFSGPKIWWNARFGWLELRGGKIDSEGLEIDAGHGFQSAEIILEEGGCLLIVAPVGLKALRGPGWMKRADPEFSIEFNEGKIRGPTNGQMTLHFESDPRFSEGLGIDVKRSNGRWQSLERYRLDTLWRHVEVGLTDDSRFGPSLNFWLSPKSLPLIHLEAECDPNHFIVLSVDSRFSPAPLFWEKQSRSTNYESESGIISVNLAIEPHDCKRHMLYDRLVFVPPVGFGLELNVDGGLQPMASAVILEKRASSTKKPWWHVDGLHRNDCPMPGPLYPTPEDILPEEWGLLCCRLPTYAKTLSMTQDLEWIDRLPDSLSIADISPEQMRWMLNSRI